MEGHLVLLITPARETLSVSQIRGGRSLGRSFLAVVGRLRAQKKKSIDLPVECGGPQLPRDTQPVRSALLAFLWARALRFIGAGGGLGQSECQEQGVGWGKGLYSALSSLVSVVILRRFSRTLMNSGAWSCSL